MRCPVNQPPILFNDVPIKNVLEQKHLGIILDSKLSICSHIKAIISKCRQGIGKLRFLSKYLPRHTLNEIVIYHTPRKICEFSHRVTLTNQMEKLESTQYSAAQAVTGAWKGTSGEKLYDEFGWESLNL